MSRRPVLSVSERESLLKLPDTKDDLIRHYTFSETDLSVIRQKRGSANRLGFAVLLCYLRFPGVILGVDESPFPPLLQLVATQLKVSVENWSEYGQREQTRREHLIELQTVFGFKPFTMQHYKQAMHILTELGMQTDKGIVLASALIENLRNQSIILPATSTIERACSEGLTRANKRIYSAFTDSLSTIHRQRLNELLKLKEGSNITWLAWLRQSPAKPNSRYMLEHIERLKFWQALDLPAGIEKQVHQNRLLKIAREGGQMTPSDLAKFEPQRRYATLVALAIEGMGTVTDEIIDLHDRIIGKLFNAARNKHQQQFQASGKVINDKVRMYGRIGQALIEAKQNGSDPFAAIEAVMPWDSFTASVTEAQTLARPADFDFLHHIGESYATLRRYAPEFLSVLKLRAAPTAKSVLDAIDVLRGMNAENARKVPADAPTSFIKNRWAKLVITNEGIDRRYYELCALSELKNALRSGDVWVQGSRQFKDFDEYLVPVEKFINLKLASELPLAIATDCDQYLHDRLELLEAQLKAVNHLATANDLPDAIITESGLKITPLDAAVPDTAGFTDHVFGLMHLLGFRFAPRIRDLGDTKLFIPKGDAAYDALKSMISSDKLNIKQIRTHWDEILRLATSIKQGTVTASLMLRRLGSYPRQNGLAVALRELGRIERTLFILDWLQSVELRRRVQAGLNKGEARNALARAVFFNRLGEIRDRSFEQQRYRASGLNLVTAAIVLWNTVYLERATNALRELGKPIDNTLLQFLSPLGWEHINLTGDYLWRNSAKIGVGKFRPLRLLPLS